MKAKVIIENGQTDIILVPENDFEVDVIEKMHSKKDNFSLETRADATYQYGTYSKHKIEISIKRLNNLDTP